MAADLLEVAATVYAVDRNVGRPREAASGPGAGWGRQLWLEVPVRQPEVWAANARRLSVLLEWLTDDRWELDFCQLAPHAGPLDEPQGFLFDMLPGTADPVLFSGGLDSAAGLARQLMDGSAVAISVHTNNWMQHVQQRVIRKLHAVSNFACVPLRYKVSAPGGTAERSQRSRGLLFLAAGIATSWGLGQSHLRVFENGIGAINLPYLRSQYGSKATKSSHPRTLRLAEELAEAISGRPFRIEAPYLTATKAESIRATPQAAGPALALTVSCDTGFSARVTGHDPCGTCTSCLLRRQALHAAGRADLDAATRYRGSGPEARELKAMLWQVGRLRDCLTQQDPWQSLISAFPELVDVAPMAPADVIKLYRSYVQEWDCVEDVFGVSSQLWWQDRTAA